MSPTPSSPRPLPIRTLLLPALALLTAATTARPLGAQVAGELSELEARSIGPAGMSGRVADVEVVPGRRHVLYVGSATGGVWKSTDAGHTWRPVFDDQPASSIGAVAAHPENPDLVWVGTGEGNPRNSAGTGRGVWKSLDGGASWSFVGLEDSERIARILVHPDDPDVAYVAAMGPMWEDGGERGVYRTTDGGESWERVLAGANDRTGAADLVMDPENPSRLVAALWEYRRWPHFFESGGPGSGIWVTHDGGETWERRTAADGLPEEPLGRIGLAMYRQNPEILYALVEAERSELLRSDDGGRSWRTVSDDRGVNPRPFYYADIRVDPSNENRLYRLAGSISVSEDAGRSWERVVPSRIVHGDVHELWIDPADSRKLILGSDGGVFFSHDRGESWRFAQNLPLAQFYEISVDDAVPFNVYGGMQDNGSWYGPSQVWREKGIMNQYWMRVGGGDGFGTLTDRSDPDYGYSESQQGNLYRFHKPTGASDEIRPAPPEDGEELRFNWNAPVASDPFDPAGLYFGSQFVHHTTDNGRTWERISPDLTTDNPEWQRQDVSGGLTKDATGAENYTTVFTIAPSPVERGVIWAGTDDGNVQVTRDGGETWTNVEGNMPDKPRHAWVAHIEASTYEAGAALAVVHDYMRGDRTTYVYRTADYGSSWTRLPTDGVDGFARVVLRDPEVPELMWLGGEFGLWVSLDAGETWTKWTHGVPTVPVHDLAVQERDAALVVGTHGRGAFVIDDLRPLRELARDPALAARDFHLFTPSPGIQHPEGETLGFRSSGHTMFRGDDRPYGAFLTYWVGEESAASVRSGDAGGDPAGGEEAAPETGAGPDSVRFELRDAGGQPVAELAGPATPGLHRIAWDLERRGFGPDDPDVRTRVSGPEVVPGTYRVHARLGESSATDTLSVRLAGTAPYSRADREARYAVALEAGALFETAGAVERRLEAARDGVARLLETLEDAGETGDLPELRKAARRVQAGLDSLHHRILDPPPCQGICEQPTVLGTLYGAYFAAAGDLGAPTPAQRQEVRSARSELAGAVEDVNAYFAGPVTDLAERVRAAGLSLVPVGEQLTPPAAGG